MVSYVDATEIEINVINLAVTLYDSRKKGGRRGHKVHACAQYHMNITWFAAPRSGMHYYLAAWWWFIAMNVSFLMILRTSVLQIEQQDIRKESGIRVRFQPRNLSPSPYRAIQVETSLSCMSMKISVLVGITSLSVELYNGSPLTVATSSILIIKFKAKHKLSLQDLLNLIKPTPNKSIALSYLFNKQFGKNSGASHYFCNSFPSSWPWCCPNELCNSNLSDSRFSFTEVPIIP